jgi:hypothetical protein
MSTSATAPAPIRSTIPARLDRLRWTPFHTRMVAGLGAAWILDGLQITIASSVTGVLTQSDTLGMSSSQVIFGINAGGKSLEDITKPLTAVDEPSAAASPSAAEAAVPPETADGDAGTSL